MAYTLLRSKYQAWIIEQADDAISGMYTPSELEKRLKVLRQEVSKNATSARYLDRLSNEERRQGLLKVLRKEVAAELELQAFEEWAEEHGQGVLFS